MLLLLAACVGPTPLVGDTVTDDGTWRLGLAETTYDQGLTPLVLTARATAGDAPASALTIYVRPDMDTMGHALGVVDFVEEEPGLYTADVRFDMSGIWYVTGYAADDTGTEGFTFVVEVSP